MATKIPAKSVQPKSTPLTTAVAASHRAVSSQEESKDDEEPRSIRNEHHQHEREGAAAAAAAPDLDGAAAPTTPSTEASGPLPLPLNLEGETPRPKKPGTETKAMSVAEQETASPVGMVRRAASSGSVSSDLSSSSAATAEEGRQAYYSAYDDSKEAIQRRATDGNPTAAADGGRRRSQFREAGDVPPAPPSTPASHQSMSLSFSFDGLPDAIGPPTLPSSNLIAPFIGGGSFVNNAYLLEKQQMLEGGGTPAFKRPAAPSRDSSKTSSSSMYDDVATPKPGSTAEAAGAATPKPASKSSNLPKDDFADWNVSDRYELVRILGRGSYGEVAQAIDRSKATAGEDEEHSFVAIKRIQSPFDQQVDAVRLYREIHILRRMNEGGEDTHDKNGAAASVDPHRQRHHDCIIRLLDVLEPPSDDLDDFHDLYLVFECKSVLLACSSFAATFDKRWLDGVCPYPSSDFFFVYRRRRYGSVQARHVSPISDD